MHCFAIILGHKSVCGESDVGRDGFVGSIGWANVSRQPARNRLETAVRIWCDRGSLGLQPKTGSCVGAQATCCVLIQKLGFENLDKTAPKLCGQIGGVYCLACDRCGVNGINCPSQNRIECRVVLLRGQAFGQSPRKACDDTGVLGQARIGFGTVVTA